VVFNDAATYYNISTVNYLAAGSCNFNDSGATLWPLDRIIADTQYYVRDAVIEFIQDNGTINPSIDGRLQFTDIQPTTTSTTTTVEPATTTTTTAPAGDCMLRVIPRRIHKLLGSAVPIKSFILAGDADAKFPPGTAAQWNTSAIKPLVAFRIGKRVLITLVVVNAFTLEAGEIGITAGDCTGSIEVKPF
jgi:hypothetical protein